VRGFPVRLPRAAAVVCVAVLLGCVAPASTGTAYAGSTASPATVSASASAHAVIRAVPAAQWRRIVAVGAWHAGCPVGRSGLRRVEVNFHGFDHHVHRGLLVVNADVAASVAAVLTRLFDRGFPIRRMRPIEEYAGDDAASMRADNTSAYNCRRAAQANASPRRSPHANGRAIDLDPYENPWVDPRCGCWRPSARFAHHRSGAGVVVRGGVAWTVFTRAGWIWQDSATTDFQHFDTGYPSKRRRLP
jgi:hypothetical protein